MLNTTELIAINIFGFKNPNLIGEFSILIDIIGPDTN